MENIKPINTIDIKLKQELIIELNEFMYKINDGISEQGVWLYVRDMCKLVNKYTVYHIDV